VSQLIIGAKPIRQPDERSLMEALRITCLVFAIATPFFLYMGISAGHVTEEYRLSRLVESRRLAQRENERLLLTRDALLSPMTVSLVAREKLGMVEEDAQEWSVGAAPEKDRAGERESGKSGAKVEKKAKKEKNDQPKPASMEKQAVASLDGTPAAKPEVAAKAPSYIGQSVEAVAKPKTAGGPEKSTPAKPSNAKATKRHRSSKEGQKR
jgi:hypothetical protein